MKLRMDSVQFLLVAIIIVNIAGIYAGTVHIVTSPSSSCPGNGTGPPCFTLQQYATQPSVSGSNITLQFEAGNHMLDSSYHVPHMFQLILYGEDVMIQCSSSSVVFISVYLFGHFHINGLSFYGCGLSLSNGAHVRLSNVEITGGNGLQMSYVQQLNMESCVIQQITGYSALGIYTGDTEANLTDCHFLDNYNIYQPAIAIWNGILRLFNSTFTNNSNAMRSGGAIYVSNGELYIMGTNFTGNNAGGTGGAIYYYGRSVTVMNTQFYNNSASGGGAIYTSGTTETIINSVFNNNYARNNGGAIYMSGGSIYVSGILGTVTVFNYVSYGGVIYTYNSNILNTIFSKNTALNGGALLANSHIAIINTSFSKNSAIQNGGSLTLYADSAYLYHCIFVQNTAGRYGGAITVNLHHLTLTSLVIRNSTFNKNSAQRSGGGIHMFGKSATLINISLCLFSENSVSMNSTCDSGGGIYISMRCLRLCSYVQKYFYE